MINKFFAVMVAIAAVAVAECSAQRVFTEDTGASVTTLVTTNIPTGGVVTNPAPGWTKIGTHSALSAQLVLNGLGAGATNSCAVATQVSCDGTNPVSSTTLNLNGTGATTTSCISNITLGATAYWRWRTITSTANGTGTNLAPTLILNRKTGF